MTTRRALLTAGALLALAGCGGTGAEDIAAPEPTGEVRDTGQDLSGDADMDDATTLAEEMPLVTEPDPRLIESLRSSSELNKVDLMQFGDETELTQRADEVCLFIVDPANADISDESELLEAISDIVGGATVEESQWFLFSSVVIRCPDVIPSEGEHGDPAAAEGVN